MDQQLEMNKAVVQRFNQEVIEAGNMETFAAIMHPQFINRTAAPGVDRGAVGIAYTFNELFRPAFPDLKVTIFEQVAEGDLVTTRKAITGTFTGPLLDIIPTGQAIIIHVMDMVRIRNGQYFEHWGVNTFQQLVLQLRG